MSSVFYTRKHVRRDSVNFSHGGRTVQSDKRDCDINLIMRRYKETSAVPLSMLRSTNGIYADVSEFGDYKDCLNKVVAAEQMFMGLDSRIRARFSNDPGAFLAFASDPTNAQELIDLGLATESVDPVAVAADKAAKRASKRKADDEAAFSSRVLAVSDSSTPRPQSAPKA